jgi:hypothetical protein
MRPSHAKIPEFFVSDTTDDDEEPVVVAYKVAAPSSPRAFAPRITNVVADIRQDEQQQQQQSPIKNGVVSNPTTIQYAALAPGAVVQIQVGDVSQARKAWKKRRRTGSPLLVPCSVLTVDRQAMVRWNLIYLLDKFGSGPNRLRISLSEMARRHTLPHWVASR